MTQPQPTGRADEPPDTTAPSKVAPDRRRQRRWLVAGVGLAVIAILTVAATATDDAPATLPFRPAPPIDLVEIGRDDARVRLSDHLGTPVLVNFWASWCVPCLEEMPTLEQLAQQHNGRLVIVGVNMWDDREAAVAMMKELGITYRSGFDADSKVVQAYDITVVPSTLFITADGRMAARASGKPSPAELNDMLSTHLQIPPESGSGPATVPTTLNLPR